MEWSWVEEWVFFPTVVKLETRLLWFIGSSVEFCWQIEILFLISQLNLKQIKLLPKKDNILTRNSFNYGFLVKWRFFCFFLYRVLRLGNSYECHKERFFVNINTNFSENSTYDLVLLSLIIEVLLYWFMLFFNF